jgi:hypothetical protein
MLVNVDLSWEPSEFTTVMMATEMPAAIRPYSGRLRSPCSAVVLHKSVHDLAHRMLLLPSRICSRASGRPRPNGVNAKKRYFLIC